LPTIVVLHKFASFPIENPNIKMNSFLKVFLVAMKLTCLFRFFQTSESKIFKTKWITHNNLKQQLENA